MKENIVKLIDKSIKTKIEVKDTLLKEIELSVNILIDSLKSGNKILVCGNGGSAADAQHFVAELIIRFEKERKPLPAIALTTNSSNITSCSNDYSYDSVFNRQIDALGKKGDVLIGITTSGNSKNIIEAFKAAKDKGMRTICLNGKSGGEIVSMDLDSNMIIPSDNTANIQEAHIMIIHIWCKIIDERFE